MFFVSSCSTETNSIDPNDPTDLIIDILVYDDGSGTVVVNAAAMNTVEYQFDMNDGALSPYVSADGYYEYTYKTSGSYLVEIRAYGASGRYLRKEKRILVPAEDPVDVGLGYSTPISYPGMKMMWNDEFSGTTINEDNWSYDIGTGCPNLCGWGNNELEYYRSENCWVQGGVLTLEARKETFQTSEYTSGKIVTRNKQAFKYGRIDIRATMPKGQGIWPALWLLGTNQESVGWPKCGEIDIMEMVGGSGRENSVSANAFWDNNGTNDFPKLYTLSSGTFADEYHVFSLIWDEQKLTYLVDDNEYHSINITPTVMSAFHKSFYLLFNVAVGGNWPGSPDNTTIFPTRMRIDYVRIFEDL